MTTAVLCKYPYEKLQHVLSHKLLVYQYVFNNAGSRITHLGSDMQKKLKAAYTLIEQLYTGAQRIICTAAHNNPPPALVKETLEKLSMLPADDPQV